MCQILDRRPHAITILPLSLFLFPQNRGEFNLSVTKLRDQSGARSDNGMGAGEPGWNTSSVQQISGEKEIFTELCSQKVSSKVADNRENKLTNKSFSDYLICLIIFEKVGNFFLKGKLCQSGIRKEERRCERIWECQKAFERTIKPWYWIGPESS